MIRNTLTRYGSVAKFLHWTMSLAVITMLIVGFTMDSWDEPFKSTVYGYHEELGLTILGLLLFRLYWRWQNPVPTLPDSIPVWQRAISRLTHYLLYITLSIMIGSGWAKSTASGYTPNFYGLFDLPMPFVPVSDTIKQLAKQVHVTTVWFLISLISLHILAALYHHFVLKDGILRRMLPSRKD